MNMPLSMSAMMGGFDSLPQPMTSPMEMPGSSGLLMSMLFGNNDNLDSDLVNVLNRSFNETGGTKRVVRDDVIERLPTCKCEEEEECPICQDAMPMTPDNEENPAVMLLCNHKFHKNCIVPWLQNESNTCPVCRKPMP